MACAQPRSHKSLILNDLWSRPASPPQRDGPVHHELTIRKFLFLHPPTPSAALLEKRIKFLSYVSLFLLVAGMTAGKANHGHMKKHGAGIVGEFH